MKINTIFDVKGIKIILDNSNSGFGDDDNPLMLNDEKIEKLKSYNVIVADTPVFNVAYLDSNNNLKTKIVRIETSTLTWNKFFELCEKTTKENLFLWLYSIKPLNDRKKKIYEILSSEGIYNSDDMLNLNFRYKITELCPVLDKPIIDMYKIIKRKNKINKFMYMSDN